MPQSARLAANCMTWGEVMIGGLQDRGSGSLLISESDSVNNEKSTLQQCCGFCGNPRISADRAAKIMFFLLGQKWFLGFRIGSKVNI